MPGYMTGESGNRCRWDHYYEERDLSSISTRDTQISNPDKLSNALAEPLNSMYKSPLVGYRSVNGCVYAYMILSIIICKKV